MTDQHAQPTGRYSEGDWFAVPLPNDGFALGLVSRANAEGVLLGYFFGPKFREMPGLAQAATLIPADAVLVRRFGHLGLRDGLWPVLGQLPTWEPGVWPMPAFGRYESLSDRALRVTYDPDDPNKWVSDEAVPAHEVDRLPKDGLLGYGAVEKLLTTLLR